MDNTKIHDSQFNHLNKLSLLALLENKKPSIVASKASIHSVDTGIDGEISAKLLPNYRFAITEYHIAEHVEYTVVLHETYKILRRNISKTYAFRTRYSRLEALDQKLGGMGLPAKKWFGNRNREFVERRKVELEDYLNRIARCQRTVFYRFVQQIKDGDYNSSLTEKFSIE